MVRTPTPMVLVWFVGKNNTEGVVVQFALRSWAIVRSASNSNTNTTTTPSVLWWLCWWRYTRLYTINTTTQGVVVLWKQPAIPEPQHLWCCGSITRKRSWTKTKSLSNSQLAKLDKELGEHQHQWCWCGGS